jgi:hypothetical protein
MDFKMLTVWWIFSKWLRVFQSRALRVIFGLKLSKYANN